jgi:glyoxylase-like metal-dependent hydrolase (beta-lactamase superfamily II)
MTLKAEVFVSPQTAVTAPIKLPFTGPLKFSPSSSTLIYGEKEALLVDTPMTSSYNDALATWIESKLGGTRTLTKIYITHGHADHFLGITFLRKRFPNVQAIATSGTIDHMKEQLEPQDFNARWATYFPGQIPELADVEIAEPLTSDEILLEGHVLKVIELGFTDTHASTALFVPEIGLAVCGDAVYGDVHPFLVEANTHEKRQEWIKALETIKALQPKIVVAGHKQLDGIDSPESLDKTINYIRDFESIITEGPKTSRELFDRVMEKYGERLNPGALEAGCHRAFAK